MAKEFLLEIGTEEIPSRFINPALEKMKELFAALLAAGRVASRGEIRVYGTPRRLVLYAPELDERQADIAKEVTGPPKKVAFDASGKPTKAATVFAEKNGLAVEALTIKTTDKGEYLTARVEERGGDTGCRASHRWAALFAHARRAAATTDGARHTLARWPRACLLSR